MKLKIAAIIAVVVLLGAIGAYLLDFPEKSPVDGQPRRGEEPSQVSPKQAPDLGRPEAPQASKTAGRDGSPRSGDVPKPGVPLTRPPGNFPPAPAPKGTGPTLPGSTISPAVPDTASPPPIPADPELNAKAAIEVDRVSLMLRDYRTRIGENPTGTNSEIMKAVMGGNPKQARLGPPEGQQLNGEGELMDLWGTPYFFHQLSKTSMEIRSAGPDRVMWTDDDVVQR